jgi:hypothetical protein
MNKNKFTHLHIKHKKRYLQIYIYYTNHKYKKNVPHHKKILYNYKNLITEPTD